MSEPPPTPVDENLLQTGSRRYDYDAISKGLAALAILAYALGFAIVTVHNGSMNLPDPNPLKPRLAYVGFVFLVLTIVPVATTFPILRRLFQSETPKIFFATWLLSYTWASLFLTIAAQFLFDYTPNVPSKRLTWYGWVFTIFAIAISTLSYFYQDGNRAQKVRKAYLLYLLAFANTAIVLYQIFPRNDEFTFNQLRLWIFVSGVLGGILASVMLHSGHRKRLDWPLTSLYLLYLLSIYPVYVFPHIKSAFAGGAVKDVTVYFSKSTSTFGCIQLRAKMLDESDQGFYIQLVNKAVIFVPRTTVEAVAYGSQALPTQYTMSCVLDKGSLH